MITPRAPAVIDTQLNDMIDEHGVDAVLAALCRITNERGMRGLFRKLNAVNEWLARAR